MFFIISHDDTRFQICRDRLPPDFPKDSVVRVNVTPESNAAPIPTWWEVPPVTWAVIQAHVQCLRRAYEAGEDAIIFEHDVIFAADFSERYPIFMKNLPDHWDMAYLGGQLLATHIYPEMKIDAHVVLAKNVHRAHAYIARHRSIPRILEWFAEACWPGPQVVDWRYGYLHMQEDFYVYIPACDWLCGQGEGYSDPEKQYYPDRWWYFTEPKKSEENAFIDHWMQTRQTFCSQEKIDTRAYVTRHE